MSRWSRCIGSVALLLGVFSLAVVARAVDKPLALDDLVGLVELQIDDEAIVAKVLKGGVAFAVDDAALLRLKAAGASDAVLAAVLVASQKKPPAAQAITYADVLKLVSLGLDEGSILKRLEKSPTVFTLSAAQVAELKQAGASEKLIAALTGGRAVSAQASELVTDFAIVLDCSGSMKELMEGGETKMAAAKRVVADIVQKIPNGMYVTFVIYGHEVRGAADDERNCQAVKIARPLSPLDDDAKSELAQLISKLQPTGVTPIALALRTAGEELTKNDAYCGLVLITDGLESCQGDPAAEAATLARNPKLTFGVNVVGFGVKPEEHKALAKIAEGGGGKYYDADSVAELTESMGTIVEELEVASLPPEADEVLINLAAEANGGVLIDCPAQYGPSTAAKNLIDSPGAGFYCSPGGSPMSIVVGFQDGKAARISAVAVNPATDYETHRWVSQVEVEVSATYPFTGFKSMGTFDVPAIADDAVLRFDESVVARYVRFNFLKQGEDGGDYMTAAEVMVLGTLIEDDGNAPLPMTNLALAANGGKVIKISSEYYKESAANLIDGSPGKSWCGTSGGGQMAVIELAQPSAVSYVAINPYYDEQTSRWVQEAEILLSMSDPVGYKSAGKITLGPIGRDYVLTLRTPVKAKFVKVVMAKNNADYVQANEIKVFAASE